MNTFNFDICKVISLKHIYLLIDNHLLFRDMNAVENFIKLIEFF